MIKLVCALVALLALPASALAASVEVTVLLSVSGPQASSDTGMVVRGADGFEETVEGPRALLDLAPGRYTVEARSGLATGTQQVRVRERADRVQTVRVNLRAGVLSVRSRGGVRAVLAEAEPDVFGERVVLAETLSPPGERLDWALTVPQGVYRLAIEGDDGRTVLDQPVEIVPSRVERITTR